MAINVRIFRRNVKCVFVYNMKLCNISMTGNKGKEAMNSY